MPKQYLNEIIKKYEEVSQWVIIIKSYDNNTLHRFLNMVSLSFNGIYPILMHFFVSIGSLQGKMG